MPRSSSLTGRSPTRPVEIRWFGGCRICNAANQNSTPKCSAPDSYSCADTLEEHDQARLDQLFAHPRLQAGWQALQELHGLYLADDRDGALEALNRFTDLYITGQLPEFHQSSTPSLWSDQILDVVGVDGFTPADSS